MNTLSWTAVGLAGASAICILATALAMIKQSSVWKFRFFLMCVMCLLALVGTTIAFFLLQRKSETQATGDTQTLSAQESDLVIIESATPFSVNCGNSQLMWSMLDENATDWNLDGMWCSAGKCSDGTTPVSGTGTCSVVNPCSFKPSYDNVNNIPTTYRVSLQDSSGIPSCWDIRALIVRLLQGLNGLTKVGTTAYLTPSVPNKYFGSNQMIAVNDMDVIKARASAQAIKLPVTFDVLHDFMKQSDTTSQALAKALLAADMHFILYDPATGHLAELSSTDQSAARECKSYTGKYGWVDSATYAQLKSGVTIL